MVHGGLAAILLVAAIAAADGQKSAPAAPASQPTSVAKGKQAFSRRCAGCHGLDGRGGERAPDIARKPEVRRMSDSQLAGLISNGIPDFGMPAFRLIGSAQINDVVAYLRTLQGVHASTEWRGNPQQGRALFFGTAGCSKCHMISGEGGFLGPDLSSYGQSLTPAEIRQAITSASARNSNTKAATIVTRDGRQVTGVVRNEDNFSIQLQTADGQFHFWNKADVAKILYQSTPMMPADYGEKLSARDLDDIVNFLHTPKTQAQPQSETGEED